MPAGRPAKPLEQRRALGQRSHHKAPPAIIVLPTPEGVPEFPPGLHMTGKAVWTWMWTEGSKWLGRTDSLLITRICKTADRLTSYERRLQRDGEFVKGSMGQLVAHPACQLRDRADKQLSDWLGRCGFTPSDRFRMGVQLGKAASKLDDFMARKREA